MAGKFAHLAPVPRLLCCSLELALDDVTRWTASLSDGQIWHEPLEKQSVGFQMRHIAGSVDRLLTYARGESISEEQLAFLRAEHDPGASRSVLLEEMTTTFAAAARFAESADGLEEARFIGRKRLETPLGVLLAHIAEHTQRHTGQLIILAKLAAKT